MDLAAIPIIDHHAHSLLRPDPPPDALAFQRWFTESIDPRIHARHVPHSLVFQTTVRWLAQMLECAPTIEAVLAARAAQPFEAWTRRLFSDANIEAVLCDYGYQSAQTYDHVELQGLLPCRVAPILRLEALAERLIVEHDGFTDMRDAFMATVEGARAAGYVALKSIIAYRTGLQIEPPDPPAAAAAFVALRKGARSGGRIRLESKPLCDYLIHLALEQAAAQELPVQFHTGFGDRDADLRLATPLHLRGLIERYDRVPLVLLHAGWPYVRELAHLAAIYGNVWMDLSLAIPFATTGIPALLREALGMAPLSKLLFATDAYSIPEIYWIAARWGRWGLGKVFDEMVSERLLTAAEAEAASTAILGGNARRLYGV